MCQHLHVLPQKGALLDQDSFIVYAMDLVVEAQRVKDEMEDAQRKHPNRRQPSGGR